MERTLISNGTFDFPIDAVFTWVDGADPKWQANKRRRESEIGIEHQRESGNEDFSRFADNGELRYALRSVARFAPWVRKVHIVTAGQCPVWLNTKTVNLVSHNDIFPHESLLPVFSTRPIELCVHRIPNLAEHFIYMNDDFMLGRALLPSNFFLPDGSPLVWAVKRSRSYVASQKNQSEKSSHTGAVNRSCQVINAMFGVEFPYRMRHYPKSMSCDTVKQMWGLFHEEVKQTLASPFRSSSDISITMLYPLFLLATGQGKLRTINGIRQIIDGLLGGVAHIGASLGDANMEKKMRMIERFHPKTFCLNDSKNASAEARKMVEVFLERMFPEPSPFELLGSNSQQ